MPSFIDPKNKYSEEIIKNLYAVVEHFDREDRAVRERQIRLWKRLEYTWSSFQRLWWSETAHDWRVWDANIVGSTNTITGDAGYYDKPINIFRAFLESIIAALTSNIPPIRCSPDDADNDDDVSTAQGGDKIAELLYKHIDAPLKFIHALYIYCTQGAIFAHNYTVESEKFGTVEEKKYKDEEIEQPIKICPSCKQEIPPENYLFAEALEEKEEDEFDPDSEDADLHASLDNTDEGQILCPNCMTQIVPELSTQKLVVSRFVGVYNKPKARQAVDIWGGLYVKIANYAKDMAGSPYLFLCYESHFSNIIEMYPHLYKTLGSGSSGIHKGSTYDPYERWGRLNTQYFGEYPLNTPTVRNCWLRPSSFNVLSDEDAIKELKKKFPDGCKVVFINDNFAEACNESLDDHWTVTNNPLANYVHFDPLGMLVTSINEIMNDGVALTLQTIEHGIPQTFADPNILNFEAYRQTEATPGMIYPTKAISGNRTVQQGFHEVKTATLSGEVLPFLNKVFELGQFVSGALPSLYGGAQDNSSKTAAQYAMSRSQSLQRLQTPWKMLCFWWKDIFGKLIPAYIKDMQEDEHFVKKEGSSFINVFIRKAEVQGKLGNIELEASEQLPITLAQKKDTLMALLGLNLQTIIEAVTTPENAEILREVTGLTDFSIPGREDREKQYDEIQELIKSAPTPQPPPIDPMTGGPSVDAMGNPMQETELSSIQPELLVDNHAIQAEICRNWLVSLPGRQTKIDNEAAYRNVLLHLQAHVQMMQVMNPPQQVEGEPTNSPKEKENAAGNKPNARQQAESAV